MNEYLIFTSHGFTESPDNIEVENCQLLGRVIAENKSCALSNLKKENPWIGEVGFDVDDVIVEQVLTKENKKDIKQLLDYLWKDEEKHFVERNCPQDHIFRTILKLNHLCKEE